MQELLNRVKERAIKFRGDETITVEIVDGLLEVRGRYSIWPQGGGITATTTEGDIIVRAVVLDESMLYERTGRMSNIGLDWELERELKEAMIDAGLSIESEISKAMKRSA